jgi:ribosomal protein S18 acetylase RimI-like enzyme
MTTEPVEIITLPPDHWLAYRDLRLRALLDSPQAFGTSYAEALQLPEAHWRMRLHDAATADTNWLLFARQGEALVGMIGAYVDSDNAPDTATVIAVFIVPETRGHGISTLLMDAILDALRENPTLHKARLAVNKHQTPALNLYQRSGFTIVGETPCLMGHGEIADEFLMEKNLHS